MKRDDFAAVMRDYATLYGTKLDKAMVEAWWEQFQGATCAAFEYAMHYAVQDTYQFPTYGQVLKHINWNRVAWSGAKYGDRAA